MSFLTDVSVRALTLLATDAAFAISTTQQTNFYFHKIQINSGYFHLHW